MIMDKIEDLRREIAQREAELEDLRARLAVAEAEKSSVEDAGDETQSSGEGWKWPLEKHEYERYSRQMIVPNFGLQGQLNIKNAKVLLVGAGGLGCPAAAYLAGAGVGTLGLVDGDAVEVSNLHRQVAHSTARVGMMKVDSAVAYLKGLNPTITYRAHGTHLTPQNAEEIVSGYDLVLDCTDHPTSRYLISDICVLLSKPLISASAFQTSGQLIVLNNPPRKGPCYRCVFPKPPPPESVVGCGEGGIVGPVVGVMGVLQALEAIKLLVRGDHRRLNAEEVKQVGMLLFSGMGDVPFRTVRMRGKRKGCFACAGEDNGSGLTLTGLKTSLDYVQFCGVNEPVKLLRPEERITAAEYERIAREEKRKHVLLDVREKEHFELCSIPGSVNVPISRFMTARLEGTTTMGWEDLIPGVEQLPPDAPIYVVCRVGNDSQVAVRKLRDWGADRDGERFVGDVFGGLRAWKDGVDSSLPFI